MARFCPTVFLKTMARCTILGDSTHFGTLHYDGGLGLFGSLLNAACTYYLSWLAWGKWGS